MDNEQNHTITDLLKYSYEQKPVDFANAFNSLIGDRLETAINAKKMEIAQRIYNGSAEEFDDLDDDVEIDVEDFEDADQETQEIDYETEAPEVEDNGETA